MLKKVTVLLIVFMSAGVLFAQVDENNFGIHLDLKDGTEDTVILSIDVDLDGVDGDQYITGYTFAVCHNNDEVKIAGTDAGTVCDDDETLRDGSCTSAVQAGADMTGMDDFFFHQVNIIEDGVVLAAITGMNLSWGIETGQTIELYELQYDMEDDEAETTIRTCDNEIGSPLKNNVVAWQDRSPGFPQMAELVLTQDVGGACDPYAINIASAEDNVAVVTFDIDGPEGETENAVTGFSFGVAHDSDDVSVESIEQGQAVIDALDGDDIAWWTDTIIEGEGVTVSALLSFEPSEGNFKAIPECTSGAEVAKITYCKTPGVADVQASVSLTGELDPDPDHPAPPVAIEIVNNLAQAVPGVIVGDPATVNVTQACDVVVEEEFIRGDANQDGRHSISDAVSIAMYLFDMGADQNLIAACEDSADVDDSGELNITDAVFLLQFLFTGGEAIPEPMDACGVDPTDDQLDCPEFSCP